jgi:hypothetical protein
MTNQSKRNKRKKQQKKDGGSKSSTPSSAKQQPRSSKPCAKRAKAHEGVRPSRVQRERDDDYEDDKFVVNNRSNTEIASAKNATVSDVSTVSNKGKFDISASIGEALTPKEVDLGKTTSTGKIYPVVKTSGEVPAPQKYESWEAYQETQRALGSPTFSGWVQFKACVDDLSKPRPEMKFTAWQDFKYVLEELNLTHKEKASTVEQVPWKLEVFVDGQTTSCNVTSDQSLIMGGHLSSQVGDTVLGAHRACGDCQVKEERWFTRWRRRTADKLTPPKRQAGTKRGFGHRPVKAVRKRLADWIRPKRNPVMVAVAEGIADGYIVPIEGPLADTSINIPNMPKAMAITSEVLVQTKKRARGKNRPMRIPVLAGELVAILRAIHGPIDDTPDNRTLIYQDCSRRARALKLNEDPRFKCMREHDMHRIIKWAASLFWLASDVDEDIDEMFSDPATRESVAQRNLTASRLRGGKHA